MLIVGRNRLEEYFSASEEDISFAERVADGLQLRYLFNESIAVNQYHAIVTRAQLTRHIPEIMPSIEDELMAVLNETIPLTEGIIKTNIAFTKTSHPFAYLRLQYGSWQESVTESL